MLMDFTNFDWNEGNRDKCRKHGVSVNEIEQTLRSGAYVILPDIQHSHAEDRFIAAGRTLEGRPLLVVFTLRECGGEILLRPISARYMHAKEAKRYEQADPKTAER